jgi:hypothetical protein
MSATFRWVGQTPVLIGVVLGVLGLAGPTGCSPGGGAGVLTCTPGRQVACACPGGSDGAQVCRDDGTGLEPCQCPDAGGGPPDASADREADASPEPADGPAADPEPPPDATAFDAATDTSPAIDNGLQADGVFDVPVTDGPATAPQLDYQFNTLRLSQPGPDQNSDFMRIFNTTIPLLQSGALAEPLVLLVRFSDVTFGRSLIVDFCQGQQHGSGYDCQPGGPASETAGFLDESGNLTTDPTTLAFSITSSVGTIGFTLKNFTVTMGVLDPTANNGAGATPGTLTNGTFTADLDKTDLCAMPPLDNATAAGALNCPNPITFADLLDGPVAMCGQDGSANTTSCTFTTDPTTHNPPTADGLFPLAGNFDLVGATYVP